MNDIDDIMKLMSSLTAEDSSYIRVCTMVVTMGSTPLENTITTTIYKTISNCKNV